MPPTSNHAYLESTGISTVLAEAVAGILRERPADPIEALAERLKAHKHKSPSSSPLDDEEARKDEKPIIEHARAVELRLGRSIRLSELLVVLGSDDLAELRVAFSTRIAIVAAGGGVEDADEAEAAAQEKRRLGCVRRCIVHLPLRARCRRPATI